MNNALRMLNNWTIEYSTIFQFLTRIIISHWTFIHLILNYSIGVWILLLETLPYSAFFAVDTRLNRKILFNTIKEKVEN